MYVSIAKNDLFCGSLSGLDLPHDVKNTVPIINKKIILFDILSPLEFSCFYYDRLSSQVQHNQRKNF